MIGNIQISTIKLAYQKIYSKTLFYNKDNGLGVDKIMYDKLHSIMNKFH